MNKFLIFPCSKKENKEGYNGSVVSLVCASSTGFSIFFPVSDENAEIINALLEKPLSKIDHKIGSIISVYKTMVDSWNSGGRFLSGIYMDTELDPNDKSEVISVKAIISNTHGGFIDNVIKMNFIHAIIIAAMYKYEIVISKDLLEKLMPHDHDEDIEDAEDEIDGSEATKPRKEDKENKEEKIDPKKFPKDAQILKIAKKIMNGRIK